MPEKSYSTELGNQSVIQNLSAGPNTNLFTEGINTWDKTENGKMNNKKVHLKRKRERERERVEEESEKKKSDCTINNVYVIQYTYMKLIILTYACRCATGDFLAYL